MDESYRLIPLYGKYGEGKFAKVSPEDYEWLMAWKWHVSTYGYVVRTATPDERAAGKSHTICMHREIKQTPKGMDTDHRDGDKLDNRRTELRVCTPTQNKRNRLRLKPDVSSAYRGVKWCSNANKWEASISVGNKTQWLGYYTSELEAAQAYDSVALFSSGEYAQTNFKSSIPLSAEAVRAAAGIGKLGSSYRGVSKAVAKRGWRAQGVATLEGKPKKTTVGYYPTELEAAQAFDRWMIQNTSRSDVKLNFPRSDYAEELSMT